MKPMSEAQFLFDEICFTVNSNSANVLTWLREFLTPSFSLGAGGEHSVAVSVVIDRERYEQVRSLGPSDDNEMLPAFVLDNSTLYYPRWKSSDGRLRAFDEAFGVFYELDLQDRAVTLLAGRARQCRIPLMRILREHVMHHGLRRGDLFLHSSAATLGSAGVAVTGTKGAGKTTVLTHLLCRTTADFVTNDRLRVRGMGAGQFSGRGVPTILTVRPGTLKHCPAFGTSLQSCRFEPELTCAESRRTGRSITPWVEDKFALSPPQYCRLVEAKPISQATFKSLLFPQVTHRDGGAELICLKPSEVLARLRRALFGTSDLRRRSELFDIPEAGPYPSEEQICELARELSEQTPGYILELGLQSYSSKPLGWLQSLLGSSSCAGG